tara:strand:- start:71 stop:574 length:504 start_codon:yes stop_codon:yes gene_type:complete
MRYKQGHIDPWWDDSFKEFEYLYLPHTDETMVTNWRAQGYTNLHLNGAIHSLNNNSYAKPFLDYFNWKNSGAALYKMDTGDILPTHKDHYITYQRVFNITDPSSIWRVIVFMEDWKSGHYFEIENKPIVEWRRGDYVMWNYDIDHMVFNMGIEPRYTLQITGTLNAN